jgi:Family of unknown function (DUF5985)
VAEAIFVLCALASALCALLLLRSYLAGREPLLFWSSVCFGFLALNNLVLFFDKVVAPDVDLAVWRGLTALVGVAALVYGLVWEQR